MNETNADAMHLWQSVCHLIRQQSQSAYDTYFQDIVPLSCDGTEFRLGIGDDFAAEWIRENYGDILSDAVSSVCGGPREIRFEFGHIAPPVALLPAPEPVRTEAAAPEKPAEAPAGIICRTAENCLAENTFANFVVGEENRYAYVAATTAAQAPGQCNPLYIYGGSGMGKTHLIQAVANEVATRNPKAVIRYTTCEEFLNEYISSLRSKSDSRFRERFRNVDLLLVDDIHFLGGKAQLQEEFFNTFNALHNASKQIIMTSDKPPAEIHGLEKRLVTRFQSGMTMQITASTYETRLAILRQMQETMPQKFREEVLTFLASHITSNIRPLKGAVVRLSVYAAAGQDITREQAETILADLLDQEAEEKNLSLSLESIQKAVADYFGLQVRDLTGSKRPKNISDPRMIAMYLCRKLTNTSQRDIGAAFGGRTHATVIHAIKQIEKELPRDEGMRHAVSMIQRSLQN